MNNQITEIHSNIFNGLINLKEIWFTNNKIKELDSHIFEGLFHLEIVNFGKSHLTKLIDTNNIFF